MFFELLALSHTRDAAQFEPPSPPPHGETAAGGDTATRRETDAGGDERATTTDAEAAASAAAAAAARAATAEEEAAHTRVVRWLWQQEEADTGGALGEVGLCAWESRPYEVCPLPSPRALSSRAGRCASDERASE